MRFPLLMLLALLCATAATAETVRVNPSKVSRLQHMVASLKDGDTLLFERGTYKTQRAIEFVGATNITVAAEGRVEIVLSNLDDPVLAVTNCQNVRISGLKARHQRPNKEYACEGAVIAVRNSLQVAVSDCELDGCGAAGVYATETRELVVFNNTIFNNSFAAIWVYNSSGIVKSNRMFKNAADLIAGGTSDITLTGNEIQDNVGNDFNDSAFSREVTRKR